MYLIYDAPDGSRDVELRFAAGATVDDLAHALGTDAPLVVEGRRLAGETPLVEAGLVRGAVVRSSPSPVPRAPVVSGLVLAVVGGLHAGRRQPLPSGTTVVGRGAGADADVEAPTVSRRHAGVHVADGRASFVDLRSTNGTWTRRGALAGDRAADIQDDDVVRVGAVHLAVRTEVDDRPLRIGAAPPSPAGTRAFNRPPRPTLVPAAAPLALPDPPARPVRRAPIGIVAVLAPVAFAGVMVVILGNPAFALFALLSPVMAVGGALEGRRRNRRSGRRETARYLADLDALASLVEAAAAAETDSRRSRMPDLAEVVRRAVAPSTRLWERRPSHHDWLSLRAGTGDIPWLPPLDGERRGAPPALDDALARAGRLSGVPVGVDLSGGGVVGLAGDREAALSVARALACQAAVHHGPADLAIAVLTQPDAVVAWDWAKWLPHTSVAGCSMLAAGPDAASAVAVQVMDATSQCTLVIVDDEELTAGRGSVVRAALGHRDRDAGIVIAASVDRLPASCTAVLELRGSDGDGVLHVLPTGECTEILTDGCTIEVARSVATSLAGLEDPDAGGGMSLPTALRLVDLLDLSAEPEAAAERLAGAWSACGDDPTLRVRIGCTETGVLTVDLRRDGPHALVAGTTGSGKSELLRTLVVGLATALPPERVVFLLIDFKGGSAFDACARLPHTVGVVTDLDGHLAQRALRCLDAELRHREAMLRAVGAADLSDHERLAGRDGPALPRLVVVVDEFATLKAELPGFVEALVGVAQRGRSLGVHLVLATQRPAGAVSDDIRANTNLRVALRVQDAADSSDVLGSPVAATIARRVPGRAWVRLGPGELVPAQIALVSSPAASGCPERVEILPFTFGPAARRDATPDHNGGPSDLDVLVAAAASAHARRGGQRPRRPWPDPLPAEVSLEQVTPDRPVRMAGAAGVPVAWFALADEPDRQSHAAHGWRLGDGNLLLYGVGGSGTTTALASIALALAASNAPERLHLYALDMGAGGLAPLAGLPHTGSIIRATERERRDRLVRHLRAELEQRSADPAPTARRPRLVVLIDGFGALASELGDVAGMTLMDDIGRVFAEGPEVGIHVAAAADRVGAVPMSLASVTSQRILLRLGDAHDYALAGGSARSLPTFVPGRGIDVETAREVQVARPSASIEEAVAAIARRWPATGTIPVSIRTLPSAVSLADIGVARFERRPWRIPLGIGERRLEPAGLVLHEGDHALVAGPARSGRTAALEIVAAVVSRVPGVAVVAVAGSRSRLAGGVGVARCYPATQAAAAVDAAKAADAPALLLIDDADHVDDPDGALAGLIASGPVAVAVVAAVRNDAARSLYQHWTRAIGRSRVGLLLQPTSDLDGELVGHALPRRAPVALGPGRGWLVTGRDAEVIQVVTPLTNTEIS